MKLTKDQQKVVDAPIGNILVSAAAGSGKTSVMTQRIVERVLSGQLNLKNILVMTFTKAAAANMRDKIEQKLLGILATQEDESLRQRIVEQLSYLPMAHISTIHAFCLDVIKNFGYDARTKDGEVIVEPGFDTLDETRISLLFQEAVDEVLTALYEQLHFVSLEAAPEDSASIITNHRYSDSREILPFSLLEEGVTRTKWFQDFERMIASLGSPRSDMPVRTFIRSFHSYLRSLPDYDSWIQEKLAQMQASSKSFGTSYGAGVLFSHFTTALELVRSVLPILLGLLPDVSFVKEAKKNQIYKDYYAEELALVGELLTLYDQGELTWTGCVAAAKRLPMGKPSSLRNADTDSYKIDFLTLHQSVSEVVYYLTGSVSPLALKDSFKTPAQYLFGRSEEELEQDLGYMLPIAARLFEVLLLVDDRYALKKRQANAIDFSDYEHLAMILLQKPDANKYYGDLFTEIYMDEYQDNSRIQEAIVACFSKDNCFTVGDVKQSIYGFRHARPQIFMERSRQYGRNTGGSLLGLNSNFRSRPGILALVNDIFGQILSDESGDIDYDDLQKLYAKRDPASDLITDPAVELLLIDITKESLLSDSENAEDSGSWDEAGESSEDDLDQVDYQESAPDPSEWETTEKEAMAVISKIRQLVETKQVQWGDIAVLSRQNKIVSMYQEILTRHNIPAQGVSQGEFLYSRELLLMESLMHLLDNFRQDIPLAAVMRSSLPQAGFLPEEIMEIHLFAREHDPLLRFFHQAVLLYRDQGSFLDIRTKVLNFCDWIDNLRSRSMYCSLSELIEQVYVETGLRELVCALPQGEQRVRDLEVFRDWANGFEAGRNNGLYSFVTYMEDIRNKKENPLDFDPEAKEKDVVHCMSIHKSKGLEFKYVFIVGLDRKIPFQSLGTKISLSENFGIGIDYIQPDEGYTYPTHSKLAMAAAELKSSLAEEMRLLYVAMTRAEENLYLVGCVSRGKSGSIGSSAKLLEMAYCQHEEMLPAWLVHKSKSYLDLCLIGLARNPLFQPELFVEPGKILDDKIPQDIRSKRTLDIGVHVCPVAVLAAEVYGFEQEKRAEESRLLDKRQQLDTADLPLLQMAAAALGQEDRNLFQLQISGQYLYEDSISVPAKISVSELKRRVNDYSRQEDDQEADNPQPLARPLNLVVQPIEFSPTPTRTQLSAAERGTLLHSVFRYLPLDMLRRSVRLLTDKSAQLEQVAKAIQSLVDHNMIKQDHVSEIKPYFSSVLDFALSDLAGRIVGAQTDNHQGVYREIPFSITNPMGNQDVTLIQGMIDCWFIEDGQAILVDYKSDHIRGTLLEKQSILQERYGLQMDYYAKAIYAASGLAVKERIIWLIPDGLSFSIVAP